ncbi:MAG: hypothetical protein E7290_04580 [Lachnospiraceae bacterium]|nr:hypothetical protein [Lachnospiraceae bacterium]
MPTKKNKIAIEDFLTLILLLFPLRKVNTGLDLMDGGYSLGNYRFAEVMDEVWKIATYLANALGALLMHLPFGDTWVGMNFYTLLMIGIVAAVSYRFLIKRFSNKYLIFLGELVALSLCWAPSTNLYQYMGYLLMSLAVLLLYRALVEEKVWCLVAAGVLLGACVLVRMPNVTYMALIIPVWYYAWFCKKNVLKQTGWCILGYCLGLVPGLLWISIRYGIEAYPNMINSLFGMTEQATDYKPTSMITAMIEDYVQYGAWLLVIAVYMVLGFILFSFFKGRFEKSKRALYILGFAVLLRFCYGRGMFGLDYRDNFSMYKWAVVFLLAVILLCVYFVMSARSTGEEKLWAVMLLVVIWVTPLGSNNGTYPIINNLFIVAPVGICMLWKFCQRHQSKFALKATVIYLIAGVSVQSILYGWVFVFHDVLPDGEKRIEAQITAAPSTKGLYGTVDKIQALDELGGYLLENNLLEERVILYGDIPAISYIFDMEPAIFTTWGDLDSKEPERLETDLNGLAGYIELKGEAPVVIMSTKVVEEPEETLDVKLIAIRKYMEAHGYVRGFQNDAYEVFVIES